MEWPCGAGSCPRWPRADIVHLRPMQLDVAQQPGDLIGGATLLFWPTAGDRIHEPTCMPAPCMQLIPHLPTSPYLLPTTYLGYTYRLAG